MIQGLEQRRRLTQFVSSEVIKAVESDSEESMAVGGERIEATVAFVQLAMLQHLKSEASPEEIFATLGDFIAAADIAASQHGGVVDKLVEDTLMLVFRADPARPEHALAASAAVLDLESQMRARDLRICAGIASGQVVSGRIGSRLGKLDLTVIGDPVNLAARLKAQAKKGSQYRYHYRTRRHSHSKRPRPRHLHRAHRTQRQKPRIPALRAGRLVSRLIVLSPNFGGGGDFTLLLSAGVETPAAVAAQTGKLRNLDLCCVVSQVR
jgi:class 3 adenylate cyclase